VFGFAASEGSGGTARDDYRTVYSEPSGRDIAGVEIQATAFANALEGRALMRPPVAAQLAAVMAWGLLIGFLCRRLRPPTSVIVAVALCACFGWAVYRRFDAAAEWWPSVVPLAVQMPIALFGGVFAIYRETRREREAVKRAFGQFLPGSVVEQLARNVGAVTASNRVVYGACLASDAEKYTTLAEQTEPGRLGELMNAYYADLFVPVERTGGVVIDVVGDAMVAIWAGSTAQAELRLGACESAIEILAALDRAVAEGRSTLPTRIGLHAGEMLIGSIGASRHFEYRAVGDIVNTASRIQALNKTLGTRALATEATVAGLDGIVARPLGHFLLPGKLTAVAVVELLGLREAVDAATRERAAAFAEVLECHAQRRWQEAIEHLDALLAARPDDGPAHFYRRRCEHLLRVASDDAWTPTIRVDVK